MDENNQNNVNSETASPAQAEAPANLNPNPSTSVASPVESPSLQPAGTNSVLSNNSINPSQPSKRLLPIVVALIAVIIGAGAYGYFGVYMQSPDVVWKKSMQSASDGITELTKITEGYKGATYKGSLGIDSPQAVSVNFEGKMKESNSETSGNLSVMGAKIDFNLNTMGVENSDYPDIYFKVKGLNTIPDMGQDPKMFSQIEDNWFYADHTLIAEGVNKTQQSSGLDTTASNVKFTEEDIKDIQGKITKLYNDYIFTNDQSKAIFVKGNSTKEDFEGTKTIKYDVTIDKDHLKAFATDAKDTLKTTKLKDMVATDGKSFEEAIDFDKMLKSIDDADMSKAKITLWADAKKHLIRNVRVESAEAKDDAAIFDLGLDYDGGDEFPFYIKTGTKNGESVNFGLKINKATKKFTFSSDIDMKELGTTKAKFTLELTPTNDDVKPEKPAGAKNVTELFSELKSSGVQGASTELFQTLNDDTQL